MARKNTLQQPSSSMDDFLKQKTDKIGVNSPVRPASKKRKDKDGKSLASTSMPKDVNPKGTPRTRKQPHRSARSKTADTAATNLCDLQPDTENLAAKEKPPENMEEDFEDERKKSKKQSEAAKKTLENKKKKSTKWKTMY